jgi:hypothetical protein
VNAPCWVGVDGILTEKAAELLDSAVSQAAIKFRTTDSGESLMSLHFSLRATMWPPRSQIIRHGRRGVNGDWHQGLQAPQAA